MTWRAFSYTLMVMLAVACIATTASSGLSLDEAAPSPVVAMQSPPKTTADPGTRIVLLVLGIMTVAVTYRRALVNLRSGSGS